MLTKILRRSFLIRQTMLEPSIVEIEKAEYEKLRKAFKRKTSDIYYEQLTRVENSFIGLFRRRVP